MKNASRVLTLLAVLTALAGAPLGAQTKSNESVALEQIAKALSRIARIMEKQLEGGKLELLMKRVEAGQRRVDQVETQLRGARRDYESRLEDRTRMEMQLAALADRLESDDLGYDPATLEMQTNHMELELELAASSIADLEARISRLENELVTRRREVEDWQSFLDRELAGLQ